MTYQQPPQRRSRANLFAVLGIVALLVVGAVVAIVVATSGKDGDGNDSAGNDSAGTPTTAAANPADARTAAVRDDALADGRAAVEVLNTLDYRDVDAGLGRWEAVATGDLLTDLKDRRTTSADQIRQARTTTTATILDAALSRFDAEAGTGEVLAAVSVDVTQEGQAPVNKRLRVKAMLELDGDDWKLSALATA